MYYDTFDSPIGAVLIAVRDDARLCSLDFAGFETRFDRLLQGRYPEAVLQTRTNPAGVTDRVARYFQGDFTAFDGLEVNPGGAPFQQRVWNALREIPAGATWTYGQLAHHIGSPKGFRAVGHANSLNPIAIVLPCHRVIGANGSLTGYAGGLERKKWLLEHEGALLARSRTGTHGKVPDLQAVLPFDGR
jgi:methylated-DNA-[protein]-cysteine S-methyltransferase